MKLNDVAITKSEPEILSEAQYILKAVDVNPALEASVRGLKGLQTLALVAYHREHKRLEDKINALRGKRKTVLKKYDDEPQYEPGRSRMPTPSGGMGAE